MTELWERQTNKEGKKEPVKGFEYFTEYCLMDKPRSMKVLCKQLGKRTGYIRQLEEYSRIWNWVERAEAYDEYVCAKKRATKERFYEELVDSELPELIKQFGIVNENISSLGDDYGSRPASISKGLEQSSRAKKNLMEIFLTLAGKPKEYTASDLRVDADIDAEVDMGLELRETVVDDVLGLVDEELESIYADRETTVDGEG